jgi:CubicO group peptidase (beta-lactamase class C family)
LLLPVDARSVASPGSPIASKAQLQELADHWDSRERGFALVVVDGTGIRHEEYRGLAERDWSEPVGPQARFYLGSLAKQLTGATIAILVEEGLLSLDDSVRSYVPELPAYAEGIVVRDLVHHTSGLRDYLKVRQMAGLSDELPFDNGSVLEILGRQRGLVFAPGERYQYSNSNYVLLAEIATRASGEPFVDLVTRLVLDPAGLNDTRFVTDAAKPLPRRARSYRTSAEGTAHGYTIRFSAVGDGGAYSTARDLARWCQMLLRRDVLDAGVWDHLLTPDPRRSTATYAFGLHVREHRGVRLVEHGGSMLGFEHWMAILPDRGLGFVLLTNDRSFDTHAMREELIGALAGEPLPPEVTVASPPPDSTATDGAPVSFPALPDALFGLYENDEIPVSLVLEREGDRLFVTPSTFRKVELHRKSLERLEGLGGAIVLRASVDAVPHLILESSDLGSLVFKRVAGSAGTTAGIRSP